MKNKYYIKKRKVESLDVEELFLDSAMDSDNNMEISLDDKNIKIIKRFFFLVLFIFALQVFHLQIVKGGEYSQISENNYKRMYAVKSLRGIFYDRNQTQLIYNVPIFDLVIVPYDFYKNGDSLNEKISALAEIIEKNEAEVREMISQLNPTSFQTYLLIGNIEKDKALIIEEKIKKIEGVSLANNAIRNYVDGKYISNIVGYSGRISEKELEKNPNYFLNDTIGKDGLELFYESSLRGEYGRQEIEVDSFGREIKIIRKEDSKSGSNLVLNIDIELQKKIYNELSQITEKLETGAGASAVAINPQNGEVLSLVNYPSYDNNLFAKGISNTEYNMLINDKTTPLFNRAIAGEYPPGSTFKMAIGAAALQEKIISPQRVIIDTGVINVGSYSFLGWAVLGRVDLIQAISQSSNIYFYTIGGGYGEIEGLGFEKIKKYSNLFGFGDLSGIDLPGEKNGLIPDEQWKKDVKDEIWYIGDTYHMSIGQGDVLATPLQVVNYTAAIANGGKLFQPQIVDKIIDSEGNIIKDFKPKIIRENFIDAENLKWVQKGMRENVVSGSGVSLSSLPIQVAGKTGTAQYYGNQKTHAWYVAYAPYDNPEIAIAVIIEGGGEGHTAAVPVVKEVLKWYFENKE